MESMELTVRALRDAAIKALGTAGILDPDVDAELLIGHELGMSRGQVQAGVVTGAIVSQEHAAAVTDAITRRCRREPLQHITGSAPFRSLDLAVGRGVFVPRPETETVAQYAIDSLRVVASPEPIAVDLGTGSGAIALAMATEVPTQWYTGWRTPRRPSNGRNGTSAATAKDNAHAVFADLADALPELNSTVDVVVSNPPYIPADAVPIDPEVRLFDPEHALYGGADGLDVVRQVSITARRLLHPGGVLVIEHGELQGGAIRKLLASDGWHATATHQDFLGRDRATTALR